MHEMTKEARNNDLVLGLCFDNNFRRTVMSVYRNSALLCRDDLTVTSYELQ